MTQRYMTASEFVGVLSLLRWEKARVAIWCGYVPQVGGLWAAGKRNIPVAVADWLDARMMGNLIDPPVRADVAAKTKQ